MAKRKTLSVTPDTHHLNLQQVLDVVGPGRPQLFDIHHQVLCLDQRLLGLAGQVQAADIDQAGVNHAEVVAQVKSFKIGGGGGGHPTAWFPQGTHVSTCYMLHE